ncbi:MAG: lipopolysaccharide biosynthesis protein [Steroidobacteraceae bacterium]
MPAISNAIWLSCSRVLADVLSFLLFVAVSRAFGPAGTGQYSYSFAIGSLVALAATSGFEEFGIREYVRSAAAARSQLWSNIVSAQCAQLGLALAGFGLFLALSGSQSAPVTVILELTIFQLASATARTLFVPAMASQAMIVPALLELGCRVTAIVLALIVLLMPRPPMLSVTLLSFPAAAIALVALAYRNSTSHGARWRLDLRWSVLRATWRRTAHFAGSETLSQFYARTDLLLIAYFLGQERVGLYASDIKFVEVGIVPLTLLGMALYPVLTTVAERPAAQFAAAAREFCGIQLMLSGWLAVAITLLVPILIVPLFGARFAPAAGLLPWFALLALIKGGEVALYRLLYSVRRQSVYFRSLMAGTAMIALLNVLLIPRIGVTGAVQAAIVSTCCVVFICAVGFARYLRWRVFIELAARLAAALALTWAATAMAAALGAAPWVLAAAGCCLFPAAAALLGLVPNPNRSALFDHKQQPLSVT